MSVIAETSAQIRAAIASLPADVSHDAHGSRKPELHEVYAPAGHAQALDPTAPIVRGARGAGKSFWAGVLGDTTLRQAAATAYPRLHLDRLEVGFGFTGLAAPGGVSPALLEALVPVGADRATARAFWWATVLRAVDLARAATPPPLRELQATALDVEQREALLEQQARRLESEGRVALVVFDALDAVASTWPRRRLLLESLFEVVWALRAWPQIRPKVFLRTDQLEDDGLQFVELPKLRAGAIALSWDQTDLYGLLFARIAQGEAGTAFGSLLATLGIPLGTRAEILARAWSLTRSASQQRQVMIALAGPYMGASARKGNTYDWPFKHLADAFGEVTPRSFLGLAIGAARHRGNEHDRVFAPDGLRHGLREASKTRVEQLHVEFPWIKSALAPLARVLLPVQEEVVFDTWERAWTVQQVVWGVELLGHSSPFPIEGQPTERDLFIALERIGVMERRKDNRLDMPDLFRVAARMLKKGAVAPS